MWEISHFFSLPMQNGVYYAIGGKSYFLAEDENGKSNQDDCMSPGGIMRLESLWRIGNDRSLGRISKRRKI
jgi:hypothetical protein